MGSEQEASTRDEPVALASQVDSLKLEGGEGRLADLRGVQWRINLGILPNSSSSFIDDLRRVTADCRRRYASLRRRLLVDPHVPKFETNSPAAVIDNPLSQNPDSMWGQFFRKAELEKMVDQDLSRLYPEHGSYFQTPGCQGMLRRILLLWVLRHPHYGYGQGMHELLAPLLYVLHVDLERLSQVQKLYNAYFTDKFDSLAFEESDVTYNFDFKKFSDSMEDEIGSHGSVIIRSSVDELSPEIQTIVLLSDPYGAEGELGILLSEKFIEHDAYCMFDALMSGSRGTVAMSDFFSPSPASGSHTGLPPVIEASSALYHLLSLVDSSLHSHLIELGVEPQYFALRWLRVLFGREFLLDDLLIIWDEIFAADNSKSSNSAEDDEPCFGIFNSARGALITSLAVSMILQLRASLLATENATSCLQRLLKFPVSMNLKKLIEKARSLQAVALDKKFSSLPPSFGVTYTQSKPVVARGHSLSTECVSPTTPLCLVPDSYWEEKWRVLHKAEELKQNSLGQQFPSGKKRWSDKVKLSLSRTESDPSPLRVENGKKVPKSSVRRSLLEDLSRELGLDERIDKDCSNVEISGQDGPLVEGDKAEECCLNGNTVSEENFSIFSAPTSPLHNGSNDQENELEKSSVGSNSSVVYNEEEQNISDSFRSIVEELSLPISDPPKLPENINSVRYRCNGESTEKAVASLKERKPLAGKLQWFWKFGRNTASEAMPENSGEPVVSKGTDVGINAIVPSTTEVGCNVSVGDKVAVDQNMITTLRNLGQSMLENIQVIESVFQQDRGQTGLLENTSRINLVGKGQVTATAALKELRKISNLLSEM